MSAVTETMNLKEAFAYMNFVSTLMKTAGGLLNPLPPLVDVRVNTVENYLFNVRKVLRYSEVNPGMEDSEMDVEYSHSYAVTSDELIRFLDEARLERKRCSEAIITAKRELPKDLDLEVSLNKERHELITRYRSLLALRNNRKETMETSYKFDIDGRQTAYNVPATYISTISFDRDIIRSRMEELSKEAKASSTWIDKALITTEVDFVPRWNTSDEFEAIVASVRE